MNTKSKTGLYPRSFCKQKTSIPKGQNGLISKLLNGFIGAAMAENPAVMTASGWQQNSDKTWEQKPDEGSKQLANNLAAISTFSPTNPATALGDAVVKTIPYLNKMVQYGLAKHADVNYQPAIGDPVKIHNGVQQFMPNQMIEEVKRGKEAAAKFFEHPIVKQAHQHNQKLAKKLGLTLNDRPANISEVIRKPIKVNWSGAQGNEYANIRQAYYGDDSAELTFNWRPFDTKTFGITNIHENLHKGYYSAPIRFPNVSKEYYNNVYKPSYQFYKWKTDKLLKPEFRDGYLGDISGGEAGPNLIDLGRDLGLKLGQKYPGYEQVKQMLQNYKGFKSFIIPQLNDSKAGLRHVWDAMTGKYFVIPAITLNSFKNKNSQPSN